MGQALKCFVSPADSRGVPQATQLRGVIGQTHYSGSGLAAHPPESRFL
jgi:hypothetical protein